MSVENINWCPFAYKDAAVIAREASAEMMSRLALITLEPKTILDAGCGGGEDCALLQKKYPNAKVVGVDTSEAMLAKAQTNCQKAVFIHADAACVPLQDHSIDLIFANFLLPWCADLHNILLEFQRLLRPDGLLMLTALGPDTLRELHAYLPISSVPKQIDMHDIGDSLLQLFEYPVLDVDSLILCYANKDQLLKELIASGMLAEGASLSLPDDMQNSWEINYEIVFAHAFGRRLNQASVEGDEIKIPLRVLREHLRHGSR